jgi:CRP/FNR family nitrogen fixation transcriptional regulator
MQILTAANGYRVPGPLAIRGSVHVPPLTDGKSLATRHTLARGAEVFAEGDPCTVFYKVVSGTVRTVKLLSDGRRQIEAFHLAGDVFGLEGGTCHRYTAEAVDRVVLVGYRRSRFAELVNADPAFGEQLMTSTLTSLDRAHDHVVLLGRKNALERIASFLLDLARRMSGNDRVKLPMQRSDIADHLGLTIETVSRTLTQMVRDGLIRLAEAGRTIILADKRTLQSLQA